MVDRGERIPAKERKEIRKAHRQDFKKAVKALGRGMAARKGTIAQILMIALVAGVLVQNSGMSTKMNKLLG